MRVKTLTLKNFCCFSERHFELSRRFNLLIGDNGTGKTSILDGLAVGVGSLFLGFPESTVARPIQKNEIRFSSYKLGDTYTREKQLPVLIRCKGVVNRYSGRWSRELNSLEGRTTRQNAAFIETMASRLDNQVREGYEVILPIISYYGTGRLWLQKRQKSLSVQAPGSRFLGYLDCLDPASDEKRLLEWFKTLEIQALQEKRRLAILETVRRAIISCIEDAKRVYYNISQGELLLQFDNREIPFSDLSDGYRNVLAMVADIAVRCATLNPSLKSQAIKRTPGVVLIDEIDLHLHPKWQRKIVGDLVKTFPRIQFVATTHSPFIIQSLHAHAGNQLINLDNKKAEDLSEKSVEDIAEDIQGVDFVSRSVRYREMMDAAEEYYRTLEHSVPASPSVLQNQKDRLDELTSRFSDDPAYHAILNVEREARLIRNGNINASG